MNPDVWHEPESFRPERFLDANGRIVGRERIIPFSMGELRTVRRYCGTFSRENIEFAVTD